MSARARNVRIPSILGGAVVPEWPDFGVEKMPSDDGIEVWRASTDTHRPGTPVFSVLITASWPMDEQEARERLGMRLQDAFERAHPNGCPGTH